MARISIDKLTEREIFEAFPEECAEYIPLELKKINKELASFIKEIVTLKGKMYPKDWEIILGGFIKMRIPKEKVSRLEHLQKMTLLMSVDNNKNFDMTAKIFEEVKKIPITDFISPDYIKRANYRTYARCPFHVDKTPSMIINRNNTFKCFSCGKYGSTIDFIMNLEGLDFKGAVKFLESRLK